MKNEGNNIYSVFDEILPKEEKEKMLNQKAKVLWLTGLSGSGKTAIAKVLEKKLGKKEEVPDWSTFDRPAIERNR